MLKRFWQSSRGTVTPAATMEQRAGIARSLFLSAVNRPVWHIRDGADEVIAGHAAAPLSFWFAEDDSDGEEDRGYEVTPEGVAVIPVHGALVDSEPTWWMRYLDCASTPAIARAVTDAAENPLVKSILLHVDSPGGQVSGLAAACDAVWEARQSSGKKVYAACKEACSASYEIASQCERVYLAQDGAGGCVGTLLIISDWSAYYREMGVTRYRITRDGAEAYKGAGATGTKITDEQRADFKRIVNEYRTLFDGIIQRGRGWDADTMRALADGRVHVGENARVLGYFDAIANPADVLAALGSGTDIDEGQDPPPTDEDGAENRSTPVATATTDKPGLSTTTAARSGKEENHPMDFWDELKSRLSGGNIANSGAASENGAAPSAATPAKPEAQHPVLVAAIAAGIDTPEKFTAMKQQSDDHMTELRNAAESAADLFFADSPEALRDAKEQVKNASPAQLRIYAKRWNEGHDNRHGVTATRGAIRKTPAADVTNTGGDGESAAQIAQELDAEAASMVDRAFGKPKTTGGKN